MEALKLLAFWTPSVPELVIVLIVALLLFGKRLPEVARSLGKGIVEFKKGVKGIEDEVDQSTYEPPRRDYDPPKEQISTGEPSSEGEGATTSPSSSS
jgi:sec-independent protein translocase protein TatA